MSHNVKDILKAMRASAEVFELLLAGLGHERAAAARGGDEGWSVVEVLCHLRDNEEISLGRNRRMAEEDNPAIQAYSQEELAEKRGYASAQLAPTLAAFLDFRRQHIALLERLAPEDWERTGEHSESGTISIFTLQIHNLAHDFEHAAQIARQLAA